MRSFVFAAGLLIAFLAPARAADDGCEKFAWSLAQERAWFAAADKAKLAAGESSAALPSGAFVLTLQPGGTATFAVPPERKPKSAASFGGAVWFPAPERPGVYQVTLSDEAWIDIVQDGRYARAIGSSGRGDCPGLRKSVRFELGSVPFVLQLSGATADTTVVAIRPSE